MTRMHQAMKLEGRGGVDQEEEKGVGDRDSGSEQQLLTTPGVRQPSKLSC